MHNCFFSIPKLKTFLKTRNIAPKHSLGQNFLIDRNIVNKIIDAAQLSKQDTVIEVGAGLGVLTAPLAHSARKVIAYEIDERLALILRETAAEYKNVEIVNEDILKFKIQNSKFKIARLLRKRKLCGQAIQNSKLKSQNYKVVGSLPYYITSRILRHFLSAEHKPQSMVIMIQKEVAQRICARPPQMSLLSASVQFFGRPQIIAQVSKNCFWPRPHVDSAIAKIMINNNTLRCATGVIPKEIGMASAARRPDWRRMLLESDEQGFFSLAKAGFSSKRKTLINNLRQKLGGEKRQWEEIFDQAGLKLTVRAQELGVEEWKNLVLISKCSNF